MLQELWSEIKIDIFEKMSEKMLRLCKVVIRAKGGFFEEQTIEMKMFSYNKLNGY